MPTVVQFMSRIVVFVLVMAVSGFGVAQAQTDPDVAPPDPDQKGLRNAVSVGPGATRVTPDLVVRSARLYETDEQLMLNSRTDEHELLNSEEEEEELGPYGPVNYWFVLNWSSNDEGVLDRTMWYFYKIDGYDDRFYIEVAGTVGMENSLHSIINYETYTDATQSTARLARWDPDGALPILSGETTVIGVDVGVEGGGGDKGGLKAGISGGVTKTGPEKIATLKATTLSNFRWYSVELVNETPVASYHNRAWANKSVSYWEGEPWGLYIGACGKYAEVLPPPPPGQPGPIPEIVNWGEPRGQACDDFR